MRLSICILIFTSIVFTQERSVYRVQYAADEYDKYTSVGNLGLTITNFGILGNGWNRMEDGSIHPSCKYKQQTEILREQVEHFSYAGLWVGGIVDGERRVSTSIVDGVFESGSEGFELFAESQIRIQSSISSTTQDSMAKYYSPNAISHQDMSATFRDYGETVFDNLLIPNHIPLGLDIRLDSYAWNYAYADAFVILNYTFKNVSEDTINDLYAGIWVDPSVANFNYTDYYTPGGGFTWYDNLNGFDESEDDGGYKRNIGYQYDADGDDGWAQSYFGMSVLGSSVPMNYINTNYSQWVWTNSNNSDYPAYNMPLTDDERYTKMIASVPTGTGPNYTSDGYPANENSWLFILSAGPAGSISNADSTSWKLAPGDSCSMAFTLVCGMWADGISGDSPERRENIHVNYDWAQRAYNGEDKNRNNILDEGEDTNGNQKIDRYILPAPPPAPNTYVDIQSNKVSVYWQKNSEFFIDPISQQADFEGYKVYGAKKTNNGTSDEYSLLLQADKVNDVGYNTGFSMIKITDSFGEPDSINIKGDYYHYKFENNQVKDGWLNYYAVTAYDRGDPDANLESLESSIYSNRVFIYSGVSDLDDAGWSARPTVYPNPYRGQALWDGYRSRSKMIWFRNLPQTAEIRIFTLAGDLVDIIEHDVNYKGQDIENINDSRNPVMSGREHAWDMVTLYDQAAASGLYLFTVEDKSTGRIKEGKFLIIK